MSPVSRGRKPKKSAKRAKGALRDPVPGGRSVRVIAQPDARPESALAVLQRRFGSKERPAWFDESITYVLDGADALVAAAGPRELEQLTTELVGTQLYAAIHEMGEGLRFDWWFAELAEATRIRFEKSIGTDEWRPAFWLLHGLAVIARPGLAPKLPSRGMVKSLRAAIPPPTWLFDATRISATGEVWLMRDTYGTRYAAIARFAYPRTAERPVLLLDIDASGFVILADVGVFDDVEDAATAWHDCVGDSTEQAQPEPVTDPDRLRVLVQLDPTEEIVRGNEPRSVVDNWFRTDRRIHELHRALEKRRMPLPAAVNLYRNVDSTVMSVPFTEWYTATHGTEPDLEAVEALAEEWMEGTLPETWFAVSPRRVEFQRALIDDWMPDPVTTGVQTLMPDWVRWLGERAGLPDHLRARVDAAAQ